MAGNTTDDVQARGAQADLEIAGGGSRADTVRENMNQDDVRYIRAAIDVAQRAREHGNHPCRMKLSFARHGESEANTEQIFWNGLEGYGLTDKGRGQAEQLAENLQGTRFVAIYASPILRAVQTAEIVSGRLGIPYELADGLREYDVGILEGKPYTEARWKIYRAVTAAWMVEKDWDARIEGGESYHDIRERFMALVRRLENLHRGTDANVLLIGHGGTYRCMMPLLLSNVDNAFALEHHFAYTTCVVAELRGDEWVCLRWGERRLE